MIKECAREGCNKLFLVKHPNQRYCGIYCSKQAQKDKTRERLRRHRKRWPIEQRKTDRKTQTGYLSGKAKEDIGEEKIEINKEFRRLKLRRTFSYIKD